jgi:molybdopterin molybdotransferase
MRWMQIAIKPAKPFAFGLVDGIPVFGFPGNPVSSMVSFELLGRPALRQAMGHRDIDRPVVLPDGDGIRPGGDVDVLLLDDVPSESTLPLDPA